MRMQRCDTSLKKIFKCIFLKILAKKNIFQLNCPPGHYYSPYPDIETVKINEPRIYEDDFVEGTDFCLNGASQTKLLQILKQYYAEQPFSESKVESLRYYFDNVYFRHFDALMLYGMIRHLCPRRIIEIGCGFSSAVILDTNERFFKGCLNCTFIDPSPERFNELCGEGECGNLISSQVQKVNPAFFDTLSCNDMLIIDSSHIVKINSDVNYIFFKIMPRLAKGVYIHFHDVCWPFEYPKEWIYQGIAWNEAYLVRTFLQYNDQFKIVLFNDWLAKFHYEWLQNNMPLCLKSRGQSIWLQKQQGVEVV